mmetsp:Transcript_81492/g.143917  ORF Transcript_81492/g.143917 Transcript_81492/m.143917 type:complete len:420 (-) Transcript_81492:84-1343(-)|eukprot:CAMPEP_0197643138 /NCGR_PEP_ID=MMETSP1338-20131121/16568_1 /TAXON_ID=43686 ORGANISM="Pelagodinium beii, Strain RCC1491" /NCGR_SAMPLE_ID=MMETSP1338 /ASSEMBLY_ACC=CAM_ASM_000754 /LENGTH=419 /DNA_ID=CAMNT_0043216357 /DNA_START=76 /DNA_END=1335 /DNA_ORIENTATION=+
MSIKSRCVQVNISSTAEAIGVFDQKNSNGELPLVLVPEHRSPFSPNGWWLNIPTGCFCLMQKWGKDTGFGKPGGQFSAPWERVAYIVTQKSQAYNAPVLACPTSDNVRVSMDVVVTFNIRDAKQFVYNLGAVHFDQLLSGAVDEGIRYLVRHRTHANIRSLQGSRALELNTMLNNKFDNCGVSFSNCMITSIELPRDLLQSLEAITQMDKAMTNMQREHEYTIGNVERAAQIEIEEQARKNEQVIVAEQGKKNRALLDHENKMVKASETRDTQTIEAQSSSNVALSEKKAELDRCEQEMERMRVDTVSKAEAEAEAQRVQADINFNNSKLAAEAEKQTKLGEAEGIKLDAQAEARASSLLSQKRRFELELEEKSVLRAIAEKAQYNLIGQPGDQLIQGVMEGKLPGRRPGSAGGSGWFS